MKGIRIPALLALAAVASLASLKWLPWPWIGIALAWAAACLLAMRWSARTGLKMLWLNLGVTALTVGVIEAWAAHTLTQNQWRLPAYVPGKRPRDDVLGSAPPPGSVTHSWKRHEATLLYDIEYHYDADGLRVAPPVTRWPPDACVLFFGDSFTLGEGLRDSETMPYQVGLLGGGRFAVYNFGYHGYGPHQMLSALEHGRVASIIKCRPTHVIYQALRDHVARVAGLNTWGIHHPRYRLNPDGSVRYDGHFDDGVTVDTVGLAADFRYEIEKSALYAWISARRRPVTEQDLRLFIGVMSESRRRVAETYPGADFEVLLWKEGTNQLDSALKAAGFSPRIVEDILPSYRQDSTLAGVPLDSRYQIPFDGHPNARGDSVLAGYVVQSIIEAGRPR